MGQQDDSTDCYCPYEIVTYFQEEVNAQLRLSNALMAANAILVGFLVAVCAFGRRYRHAALVRILFLGASTLYLPAVSYVISSIGKENRNATGLVVDCVGQGNLVLLLLWTVLVQIVGTNATDIIAVDDGDGPKLGPSVELLARTIWTSCLVFFYSRSSFTTSTEGPHVTYCQNGATYVVVGVSQIFPQIEPMSRWLIVLCVLSLSKITLKFFAFEKARRSFALGRNAPLVAGYMEQLQAERHRASEDELIPPLLVMGEEEQKIEERPLGYGLKQSAVGNSMVTVDRVWQLASSTDNVLFVSQPWLNDLCLSFALFKMLRRRFAKCRLAESGSYKAFNFVLNALLNNGDPDRVFRVIADEVSFVADSYFSSLPTSHFGRLLPILNIIVSLSIITCCLVLGDIVIPLMSRDTQMTCTPQSCSIKDVALFFGNMLFSSTPVMFLIAASVLAEAWEIVSYLCSNWIKVTLLCSYVTHVSWQQSPLVQRCLVLLLKFRVNFIKLWDDQTGQISLLAHPHPKIYGLRRLFFRFSDPRVQYVKVPAEVKASIVSALRISNGSLSNGTAALHGSEIGTDVRWACDGEGTSDVILVWHIATGIFEARHTTSTSSSAGNKTAATHLSRYCVYLMAATPELLPDDEAWSKKLYKTVRTDIDRVLPSRRHEGKLLEYDQMIALLSERSDHHEVVKRGVRLGKQLVELIQDEETGWGVLAGFWSEMILYIAPSDNLKAHKEAMARGGELVTLIWALLTHAGIVTRPIEHPQCCLGACIISSLVSGVSMSMFLSFLLVWHWCVLNFLCVPSDFA